MGSVPSKSLEWWSKSLALMLERLSIQHNKPTLPPSMLLELIISQEDLFRDNLAPFLWIKDVRALRVAASVSRSTAKNVVKSLKWSCFRCPRHVANVLHGVVHKNTHYAGFHCPKDPKHMLCASCNIDKPGECHAEDDLAPSKFPICCVESCACRPTRQCSKCDCIFPCKVCQGNAALLGELESDDVPSICRVCGDNMGRCKKCSYKCTECNEPVCDECWEENCAYDECVWMYHCRKCAPRYDEVRCAECGVIQHEACFHENGGVFCYECLARFCRDCTAQKCAEYECVFPDDCCKNCARDEKDVICGSCREHFHWACWFEAGGWYCDSCKIKLCSDCVRKDDHHECPGR